MTLVEAPPLSVVYAVSAYESNADLIAAAAQLGYIRGQVLDPTYGRGTFWNSFQPPALTACDLNPEKSPIGRAIDFRDMPWADGTFDTVVLDAPYRLNGTPDLGDFDDRYGIDVPQTWQEKMQLIRDGMTECFRVTVLGGRVLVKIQDQVCSGKKRWQTIEFANYAVDRLGGELVDMLHMLTAPRPQPEGRRQVHSRGNASTMLVLRKVAHVGPYGDMNNRKTLTLEESAPLAH